MDADFARLALRRLICACLKESGWEGAEESALGEIEDLVLHHLGNIVHCAQAQATASRRTRPQARDIVAACESFGTSFKELEQTRERNLGAEMAGGSLTRQEPRREVQLVEPPPSLVEEEGPPLIRKLDIAPDKYPKLPHEHLYRQTPVFQTLSTEARDTTQIQLDHRAEQSRLVEASLRNLVKATDAAALPQTRKPGLVIKMAGDRVPVVNFETVYAIESAASSTLKRMAAAVAAPQQTQKRMRIKFSA